VHFAPPAEPVLSAGALATVRIVTAAPHHLTGSFVALVARPRHRTRIAVAAG